MPAPPQATGTGRRIARRPVFFCAEFAVDLDGRLDRAVDLRVRMRGCVLALVIATLWRPFSVAVAAAAAAGCAGCV